MKRPNRDYNQRTATTFIKWLIRKYLPGYHLQRNSKKKPREADHG
jgi:hypothetical protein